MNGTSTNSAFQKQPATPVPVSCPAVRGHRVTIGICVLLAEIVWVVFGQTLRHEFINYDDNAYVYENPTVIKGLSLHGIAWSFTHAQVEHWIPLTTISHMLDCQVYGLKPWGHHLTNVILHGAASILLFLVLMQMTGALWRSAFVAAVFAVHPLHVESVAWVSERKDVLTGVFFMLTIAAYVHYTRKPRSLPRYLAALLLFALGLMSKDMLVTLPFVLLLLDSWPLCRLVQAVQDSPRTPDRFAPLLRLILEKAPFFALSAAACVIQMLVIGGGVTVGNFSLYSRISNALFSYVSYMGQMVYPAGLAVSYADPGNHPPAWELPLAILLLGSISTAVFMWRRKHPFLLTGWLWYLGMLVPPVVGFARVGHAQSDRYCYLPQIGLYVAIAWMAADFCTVKPWRRTIAGAAGPAGIVILMWCAWIQTGYWKNDQTLWNHALAVTKGNIIAYNNLGYVLQQNGQVDQAIALFQKALEINPGSAETHTNLGFARLQTGNVNEALTHFREALEIDPTYAKAHNNLGNALLQIGQPDEAVAHYRKALEADPQFAEAHNDLGTVLQQKGELDEAIVHFQKALDINPKFAEARYNLGYAFQVKGRPEEAVAQYEKALEIKPGLAEALNNLAYLLATCPEASLRNGAKAVALAWQANKATGNGNPKMLGTLAAAYAETGRFPKAAETAQQALNLATAQSNGALAALLRAHVVLYQANTPYRDKSLGKQHP